MKSLFRLKNNVMVLLSFLMLLTTGCDWFDGNGSLPEYTVGVTVNGLTGELTLQNNAADDLVITADGAFEFATPLTDGDDYAVTVGTQPDGQSCTVTNAAGSIDAADVPNVEVSCVDLFTGLFIDDLVVGLDYTCSSGTSSETTADGQFTCPGGDDITFWLGSNELGPVPVAYTVISPLLLFPDNGLSAINLARLLQSLDSDQLPDNGVIVIDDALVAALPADLDFSLQPAEFEAAVGMTLVSLETAVQRLRDAITQYIPENAVPIADAGADRDVTVGSTVTLTGAASSDANGDGLSFNWNFVSTPAGSSAQLASRFTVAPSFVADVAGSYVVGVLVSDGIVINYDIVVITANDGSALPAAPLGLQAVAGDAFVTLSWTAVDGATGYMVYWNNTGNVTTSDNWFGPWTSGTVVSLSGLTNGTPYYYRVAAVNASGEGPMSAEVSATPTGPPPTYSVGGTVSGLTGTVTLQNNAADDLVIDADSSFTFDTAVNDGSTYVVTVSTQPAGQTCSVTNGSGTISGVNVSNIGVSCADIPTYTVGGTVSGLTGTVTLQNNAADDLVIDADGSITFATAVTDGSTYVVTVSTQPASQTCSVTNGSGTISGTNVTNVIVTCSVGTDATLSALALSAGGLSPTFASGTSSYTLSTSSATTTVTATVNQAGATITVNGTAVASGAASASIPLAVGDTDITIIVTAQDGSTTQSYSITVTRGAEIVSLELINPTPGANNIFGSEVVQLVNGNIVVVSQYDDAIAADSGAVHLYSPSSFTPIASIYGDVENDMLGIGGITALGNGNYVIASANDDEGGIVDAGSVRLVNGSTGVQIAILAGDVAGDSLGSGSIIALDNGNYVIASPNDSENGIVAAGSVRLMNGSTGAQIGILTGDVQSDQLGFGFPGITMLGNGNYVIASQFDDEGSIVNAGSVRLADGSTGAQIGAALAGDVASDQLGGDGITVLGNNNYVIASHFDDEGGIANAGSVRLVNGSTGVQIAALAGDVINDQLARDSITALGNNNYVIASGFDDEDSIVNAGSVRLMDGSTGLQIGATLAGDDLNDYYGNTGVIALGNDNYVTASAGDDVGGVANVGSVRLMNGSNGSQIGATLTGDVATDGLGSSGITALGNNNYVIASANDDEGGIVNAGSVRLMNGSTGVQIGILTGDVASDWLGATVGGPGIAALGNNNYVIASPNDDENGIVDAGSVRLANGSTGAQIGAALTGDVETDWLGNGKPAITTLSNDNYVIASRFDDEGGIVNAGSVRLVNGSTGIQIGAAIVGAFANDMSETNIVDPVSGDYYVLGLPNADNGGLVDSGKVLIVVP